MIYRLKKTNKLETAGKETILKFIEKEIKNDINFVVINSQDLGIPSVRDQKVDMKNLERMGCPLVLVSETGRV